MKTLAISEVLSHLEKKAPAETAADWDNVGLLVGDAKWTTSEAFVAIDFTSEVLAAAKVAGAKLIVTHHPCIFGGSSKFTAAREGSIPDTIFKAAREGIAVVACHTNFDACALEVAQTISEGLGLTAKGRLHEKTTDHSPLLKLAVFVPTTHIEKIRDAICAAGAGRIGNYDFCTFSTPGEGTFRGGDGSTPFLGKPGQLEKAKEVRLEAVVPAGLKNTVIQALRAAHPYDEVAFDLYEAWQNVPKQGLTPGLGLGFWGEFEKPIPFQDVASRVRKLFKVDSYWITPRDPKSIKRIGFAAGKGASCLSSAIAAGCDLFVTGEAGYHNALRGAGSGVAVLELGHAQSEIFFLHVMKAWLEECGLNVRMAETPSQRLAGDLRA